MKLRLWMGISSLLICASSSGQWNEGFDQQPIENSQFRGSAGDFGAMLLVTDDPDGFFEEWNRPSAEGYAPSIGTVDTAHRGDIVVALVLFSQCSPNAAGNCDSSVDYNLIDPAGGIYGEIKNAELWRNREAPPKGSLQVGADYMAFRVEPDDELGTYKFEVTVRDNVSEEEISLVQTITITEDGENDI